MSHTLLLLQLAPVLSQPTPFASQTLQLKKEDSREVDPLVGLQTVSWEFETDGSYTTPASLLSLGSLVSSSLYSKSLNMLDLIA